MDNFDINRFSQQLQEEAKNMQERLKTTQNELENLRVVGKAGGGMVAIEMNGRHDVISVTINPALEGENHEMLGQLFAAAVNDAVKQVEVVSQEKIKQLTSNLNNIGGFMGEGEGEAT